jgi:biopolymer transport protein ExbD
MAFIRKREQKELNLPSLIDVVFLLLIYSLLTIPIEKSETTSANTADAKSREEVDLPFVRSRKAVEIDPILRTFLVQVENENPKDPGSARVVVILKPSEKDSTLGQAMETALRDSVFARFPADFLSLSDREFSQTRACRLIRDEIRRFERGRLPRKDVSKRIEIRAVKNTEFRIVNAILRECSAFGDTLPAVAVRTLANVQ